MSLLGPYGPLLRTPGGAAFSGAGLLARMPISMTGIGAVLLVSAETGRYGLAGVTAGVLAMSFTLVSPLVARLVDQLGQARVLRPALVVWAVSGSAFVLAVQGGWPSWSWLVLAALFGASGPNVGSMVRARWAAVLGDPARRQTAFAFESVVDEVVFVTGPPLVTLLATSIAPQVGLATALVIGVVGGVLLASLRGTEPVPGGTPEHGASTRVLRDPGLVVVALTYVAIGTVFGAMDVVVIGYSEAEGAKQLAGVVLAVYAAGSLVAGLVYGAVRWPGTLPTRFLVTCTLFGAAGLGFLLVDSLLLLSVLAFLAGLTIAPVLVSGMSLVESRVPRSSLTEGLAWTTAALTLGVTIGASVGGHAVDVWGAREAFRVQTAAGLASVLLAAVGFLSLRRSVGAVR
jgi:predicted MFS family arabinose efflux permease